jgi:peptide/nickel transport system permease protein
MTGYLARRAVSLLLSLAGVTLLVTLFLDLVPGDPIDVLLGEQAAETDRQALREALGLDRPVAVRAWRFVRDLLTGELRTSVPPFRDLVLPRLAEKAPRTLLLALCATALAVSVSVPLGVLAARRRGGVVDTVATLMALVGASLPRAWLGPLLILLFAIELGWLPALGDRGPASLVLPSLTLGLAMAAVLSRLVRGEMLDVLSADFVRTARAKGLSEAVVTWRHALRNALVPYVTMLGLQFGGLLTGAIVTEKVFDWPGLGTLLLVAIQQRDHDTLRACVLLACATYVVVNQLVDLLHAWADPRVRHEADAP